MKPLTTNVNSPSVKRIAGNAKIVIIGLITVLTSEKISPAITNVQTESVAPESLPSSRTATQSPIEFIIHRNKNVANCFFIRLIIYNLCFLVERADINHISLNLHRLFLTDDRRNVVKRRTTQSFHATKTFQQFGTGFWSNARNFL